jgi:Lhr-like helicase
MQLVVHAPFGGRINRAYGLALRKRFCVGFGFELQAAANEEAIVLSLGPQHSFPLEDVFGYLHSATARDVLVQAVLAQADCSRRDGDGTSHGRCSSNAREADVWCRSDSNGCARRIY